jgi:hypothetical protein
MAISKSNPQIEETVFNGVVDISPMSDEEVSRLRREMNEAVEETMTEKEYWEVMVDRHGPYGEIIRQTEFAPALGYSRNRVTRFESGSAEVSTKYAVTLRLLHRRVMGAPRDVADAALELAHSNTQFSGLVSVAQAAKEKGCGKTTVYRARDRGNLNVVNTSKQSMILRDDAFEEWEPKGPGGWPRGGEE